MPNQDKPSGYFLINEFDFSAYHDWFSFRQSGCDGSAREETVNQFKADLNSADRDQNGALSLR